MMKQTVDEFNRARTKMAGDIKTVIADGEDLLNAVAEVSGRELHGSAGEIRGEAGQRQGETGSRIPGSRRNGERNGRRGRRLRACQSVDRYRHRRRPPAC